jgi:hypothetical protein
MGGLSPHPRTSIEDPFPWSRRDKVAYQLTGLVLDLKPPHLEGPKLGDAASKSMKDDSIRTVGSGSGLRYFGLEIKQ